MRSVITGTGHYVPERVVGNEEIAPLLGTTADWILERTGIGARRFAADDEATSDLALAAARAAMADAAVEPQQIDAIIVATLSPDVAFPGSGVFLQRKLGLERIPALDVRNQCSGFLYGLSVADAWLRCGTYRRVLLVGAEVHSVGLDLSEEGRSVSLLFGDGAGAAVLEAADSERGVVEVTLGADGQGAESLWCPRPGSRGRPHITLDDMGQGRHYPKMKGRAVFRRAVETLEAELATLLDRHGLDPTNDDLVLVPHQANRRINELVAARLGWPEERVVHTIDAFGNTTAASIPMSLDIARRDGRVGPGTTVITAAFGSGYTWGTGLIEF